MLLCRLDYVRESLSRCAAFQTLCGVDNATDALTRIYSGEADDKDYQAGGALSLSARYPRAVCGLGTLSDTGQLPVSQKESQISVVIEKSVSDLTGSWESRYRTWLTEAGTIMSEFRTDAHAVGLNVEGIHTVSSPNAEPEVDGYEVWFVELQVSLGR